MALADLLVPSFVEVGKIKIGTVGEERKSQSGNTWRAPIKLDHFIITTLRRDPEPKGPLVQDTDLMEALKDFRDKDGQLRSIPVMFGSNDLEEVMHTAYVWYVGKKLAGRSDGREVVFHYDPETGRPLQEPKTFKWHESWLNRIDPTDSKRQKPLFKLYTAVNVMIASPAARWGGFYRFRTTSEISARQLYGSLLHLRRLTAGVLRGLVFRMVVRPMVVTPNGQTTTVYVVHIEYVNSDLKQLQAAARDQAAFELANVQAVVETERQYKMLVAATKDEEPDEIDEEATAALPAAQTQAEKEVAALDEIEKCITAAADLAALGTFWNSDRFQKVLRPILDDQQRNAVVELKDKRKAELEEQAKQKPPTSPPPVVAPDVPDAEATPVESAKAGKAIVADIERLCVERGGSWAKFREEHGEEIGITATRAKDLTAEQALKVLEILKEGAVTA